MAYIAESILIGLLTVTSSLLFPSSLESKRLTAPSPSADIRHPSHVPQLVSTYTITEPLPGAKNSTYLRTRFLKVPRQNPHPRRDALLPDAGSCGVPWPRRERAQRSAAPQRLLGSGAHVAARDHPAQFCPAAPPQWAPVRLSQPTTVPGSPRERAGAGARGLRSGARQALGAT